MHESAVLLTSHLSTGFSVLPALMLFWPSSSTFLIQTSGIVLIALVSAGMGLQFPESPFKAKFMSVVNGTMLKSPVLKGFGSDHFGQLTVKVFRNTYDWRGNAVLLDTIDKGKSPETTIRQALKEGEQMGYGRPKMILLWTGLPYAGFLSRARDFSDVSDIKIPVVEVSVYFWALVTSVNNATKLPVTVIVRDDDSNPMEEAWTYGEEIISALVSSAMCLACFIVAIYKFALHLRWTEGLTTAKIYFMIDILANGMRFWYVCINPFFMNHFAYTWTTICTSTHMALSLVCTLLISLKWQELLRHSRLQATMFLSTFKWPFIAVSLIIFAIEFISSALRGHWYNIGRLAVISWSFLTAVGFIIVSLLYVSGIQILIQIARAVGSTKRIWQLNRATLLILGSGLFLAAWGVVQIAFLLLLYRFKTITLRGVNIIVNFQFAFLFATSFLQNWAMPIPNAEENAITTAKTASKSRKMSKDTNTSSQTASSNTKEESYADGNYDLDLVPTSEDTSSTSYDEEEEEEEDEENFEQL